MNGSLDKHEPALQPIRLLPARERVASVLRKAILSGSYAAGQQLTLDSVAGQLGISKTPVREAFLLLENEGLLQMLPNKSVTVLGVNEKNVRAHYQVRAALESEAAALCCRPECSLSAIEQVMERSEADVSAGRYEEYGNLNQAFHVAIWETSGNERLHSLLSVMWNGLSVHAAETVESYAKKSFEEHCGIWAAIQKRDEVAARERMHRHIIRSMEDMLTNL